MTSGYVIRIVQGGNIVTLWAGKSLDNAQDLLVRIIDGLKECDGIWSVTLEEQSDDPR